MAQVDEIVGGMASSRTWWQRVKARLSIRSLLAGTRFALPDRAPISARVRPERATKRAKADGAPESAPERSVPAPQENE